MHKAFCCPCSQKPPLLSPSLLISFDITQSLLLDLCLCILSPCCWLEWSEIVFVPRFICIMPQIISLSLFSCGASLLITVIWFMDLWILDLMLPHFSNISLPWFLPLPSLSSYSHVCYLWLIVMSIFLHICSTLTLLIDLSLANSLFPFSSALLGYRPREAWELAPDHRTSVIVVVVNSCPGTNFQLAYKHCCHLKW